MRRVRSEKQAEKWKRKLDRYREIQRQIREAAPDILHSGNFYSTKKHIQHGNMTVNDHVMDVARYSIAISDKLHIPCNRKDLIRGALLHDYFLYDWHDKNRENYQKLHGFYHPGIALKNARKEYHLTRREEDIIKKHMWPLTVVPPLCREAWVVTAADKYCSLLETLKIRKRPGRVRVGVAK